MPKLNVKVRNMTTSNGNTAPNQFIIRTKKGLYFQSYDSIIAFQPYNAKQRTQLDSLYHDYSVTTSRYLNQFLGNNTAERKKLIADKTYFMTNLN